MLTTNSLNFILIASLLILMGCDRRKIKGFSGYGNWKSIEKLTNRDSLFIVNVGDFSAYQEALIESKDPKTNVNLPAMIKVGGIDALASYLNIIKKRFQIKSIIVSANDINYQYHANSKKTRIPIDAIKVPLKHFSAVKPQQLYDYPWVNSNVLNIRTGKPHVQQYLSDKIVIKENSDQLVTITAINNAELIKEQKINGFYFQDSVSTFLKYEKEHFNIVLYHGPTDCEPHSIVKPITFEQHLNYQLICENLDPLKVLVDRLPPGSIDLIITSKKLNGAGFVRQTPVIYSGDSGQHIHPIILHLSKKRKLSYLLPPIKLCHQMLVATQDCNLHKFKEENMHLIEQMGPTLMPAKFFSYDVNLLTN